MGTSSNTGEEIFQLELVYRLCFIAVASGTISAHFAMLLLVPGVTWGTTSKRSDIQELF